MSEMIERVARAMFDRRFNADAADVGLGDKENLWQQTKDLWSDAARAAILVMREPTLTMKAAAHQNCAVCGGAGESWPLMIDVALKE